MSDLGRRWLESNERGLTAERELLQSLRRLPSAPSDARRKVWARFSSSVAAAAVTSVAKSASGGLGHAAAGGAKMLAGTSTSLIIKAATVIGLLGAAAVGIDRALEAPPESVQGQRLAPAAAPKGSTAEAPERGGAASGAPSVIATTSAVPRLARPQLRAPQRSDAGKSTLQGERQLLASARERIESGDALGALRLLAEHRGQFAVPMLGQERDVLTIEATSAAGRRAEAATLADRFLIRYPKSPHVVRVQSYKGR